MRFLKIIPALLVALSLAHAEIEDTGSYFLVIDHSGSMLEKISKGPEMNRTRWDLMRDRASGFVERLPDGSNVWAVIFSAKDPDAPDRDWRRTIPARLDSPVNRSNLIGLLGDYPEPSRSNGTWLYQSTNEALDQVEIVGARNPDAYMTVMIYTDGVDQGHGRTFDEMQRNPVSSVTLGQISKRTQQLRQRHHNLNVVNVYRPGDESILDAHVIRLSTNRVQLANPLVMPRQEVTLRFGFRDDKRLQLEGRPFGLKLESADGTPLPLKISGGPFQMTNGDVRLVLDKTGDWPSGRDVRALLKVDYPKIDNVFLVAEGGDTVDLFIQGAEAPLIRDLLPADQSTFPVGRQVAFSLSTLAGCEVEWNFGDGASSKGNPSNHVFAEPGVRTVTVKVRDPQTGLVTVGKTTLALTELKLALDPLPTGVLPGREVTLTATGAGKFRNFEWRIGGRTYAGQPRKDGNSGCSLILAFERPGPVEVSVVGQGSAGGQVESETATLDIKEIPAIRLTKPVDGEALYFGNTPEFHAEIEGVEANQLRFSLLADGKDLIPPRVVDVRRTGPIRTALMPQLIPTLERRTNATLRVETMSATPPLKREISVILESEPTMIEIALVGGREPYIHRDTPIELRSNALVREVRWDFGDGAGLIEGKSVERHKWGSYGTFTIKARAIGPDGSELEAVPVEVKVPVRSAGLQAKVIYKGKEVGGRVAKVPVNSTLELEASPSGDVTRLTWFLDGKELPPGQETITVKERGFKEVKVIAEGTPEAGSAEAIIPFRTSDRLIFWSLMAGMLVLLGVVSKLLLGNSWRHGEFGVQLRGNRTGQLSVGDPDAGRFAIGGRKGCCRWNWWAKTANVSLKGIDMKAFSNWNTVDLIRFLGGRDPRLEPGKGPRNKTLNIRKTSGNDLSGTWLHRWTFIRPVDPKNEFRIGAIFLRRRKLNWIVRYWPEALWLLLFVITILTVRQLHQILY